jgi:hypothetical protein
MKTLPLILALLVTSLAIAPHPAAGQFGNGDSVAELIARNAELLGEASALVQETNSIKARGLLDTATSLHKQSVGLHERNQNAMAGRTAIRAREVIQQTIAVARRETRVEQQATRMMDRATTRLEQARFAFEETGHDDLNARRLILESTDNLRRAREQLQEHMFETSLRLAESSLAMSNRAIRLLRRDGRGPDLAEEIDRTQRIIDRVTESRASLDASLSRLVDQATDMQRRAVRSAEQGDPVIAVEQTRGARNLALRALRAHGTSGAPAEDDALRAVAQTDDLLEGARGVLAETPDDAVARRIEDASRQQDDARRALDNGDYARAVTLTTAARDAARAAMHSVRVSVDPASVEAALARTDATIAQLRDALASFDHPGSRSFLERATARQEEARAALAGDDPRRSLALTRVAHNLARSGLSALEDAEN